jgi:Predicted metal binding domain/Protein of Unknown function (DUF2604)
MADKIDITVVVNGQPTVVTANEEAPLHTIIPKALEQTGNAGQPPSNWELRDVAGNLLDVSQKIKSFHFPEGIRLFLNLKAGVGGETVAEVQFADPAVSRAKFEREIAEFNDLGAEYGARGWFLLRAEFPEVMVLMAAPQLQPPAIITGVLFDFTNYDAMPPSVRLVNPFTRVPYRNSELPAPARMNRSLPAQPLQLPGLPPGAAAQVQPVQSLMQAHAQEDVPFLCVPGVREYHQHPGHTGDLWELHRASGAGRLVRLLEVIHQYGIQPIAGYGVNLIPQVGFEMGQPPR